MTLDFASATAAFEEFLRQHIRVVEEDLARKHELMHKDELAFFRATYYRWARLFPIALPDLLDAPHITAVGDLHIENFGTFRGKKGHLVWGVNDFDETSRLPYTNDLVRLATSGIIGIRQSKSSLKRAEEVCETILEGYVKRMKKGRIKPFTLEKEKGDSILERMVKRVVVDCKSWREKMSSLPVIGEGMDSLDSDAIELLNEDATPNKAKGRILLKRVAGLGSLGHRRVVAVDPRLLKMENKVETKECTEYELKETGPPAVAWLATGKSNAGTTMLSYNHHAQLINNDPSRHFRGKWVIRRIAPDCIKLELSHLPMSKIEHILHKMGAETANIHIAGDGAQAENKSILKDLGNRQSSWLENASMAMIDRLENDWREYNSGNSISH